MTTLTMKQTQRETDEITAEALTKATDLMFAAKRLIAKSFSPALVNSHPELVIALLNSATSIRADLEKRARDEKA